MVWVVVTVNLQYYPEPWFIIAEKLRQTISVEIPDT